MLAAPDSLPSDPDDLRNTAEQLVDLVKSQALRIARLEHQLAGHRRHRFGSTSETMDQLQLRLEEQETRAPEPQMESDVAAPKAKPRRKPLPPTLPRDLRLRRQAEAARHRRHRRARLCARQLYRQPDRPAQACLFGLRANRPGGVAVTAN